jgi:hypothetical protein
MVMSPGTQGRPALVLLALLFGGMLFSAVRDYWSEFWITQNTKQIMATIIAERSHGVREYQYAVNGIQYLGSGQSGRNLAREARVGDQAWIFYSTGRPWLSSPDVPRFSPWRALFTLALLCAIEFYLLRALLKFPDPPHTPAAGSA